MSSAREAVTVVGAGPAGTSAALALRERGIPVTVLDAGTARVTPPPVGDLLGLRLRDTTQWQWQLGRHGEALAATDQASPKLRVPGLRAIFEGFAQVNRIRSDDFQVIGALAAGGLSNAWGCGVARFHEDELGALAFDQAAMDASIERVARRMGLSGRSDDSLSDYFGLDAFCGPALAMDSAHRALWERRDRLGDKIRMGRARVAVLGESREDRLGCDLSGMCLWGCVRRATWSAAWDVEKLKRDPGVRFEAGARVQALLPDGEGNWWIDADTQAGPRRYRSKRVLLAAGTLATTRLVLAALPPGQPALRLQSNPMAAFLLWLPALLGAPRERSFGLAQLSFAAELGDRGTAFGNLFSTAGIPVSEFLAHLPIARRAGLPLLKSILSSCVVGNVFLPGDLSAHEVRMEADQGLRIKGGDDPRLSEAFAEAKSLLSRRFRKAGAWMLPGSFVRGQTGADIHYACTLPVSPRPRAHECHLNGELAGLPGLYVVDGAALPRLPAKAHTLTIMANADRIAGKLILN